MNWQRSALPILSSIILASPCLADDQAISEACPDPTKEQLMRAYTAQHVVMETAASLCALAIRTCGGQSMLKSLPLERLYRDSRCGSLMLPWTAEICLDRLGKLALYETGESDDD